MASWLDWSWILVALSLTGTVLNIKKRPAGFAIWIISNSFWVVYDVLTGLYSQAFLFFVYDILAAWGLWEWTREKRRAEQAGSVAK